MSDTLRRPTLEGDLISRPDALSVARRGDRFVPGTSPGPETYPMRGQNTIQNLLLAANEGLTVPLSNFGIEGGLPEKVWDPRLLGLIAGITAILEPGPGGEAKVSKEALEESKGIAGAAIRLSDGRIAIGRPTHMQAAKSAMEHGGTEIRDLIPNAYSPETFGFVTVEGHYVTPQQAGEIAERAGQLHPNTIIRRKGNKGKYIDLWSEDLAASYKDLDKNVKTVDLMSGNEALQRTEDEVKASILRHKERGR